MGQCLLQNYTDSGQTEGQALMGFEFDNKTKNAAFQDWLKTSQTRFAPIEIGEVLHSK